MANIKFTIDKEKLSTKLLQRIQEIASLPGVEELLVLPDIHLKKEGARMGYKGYIPSSFGSLSRDILYPQLSAVNINCGKSLIKTELSYSTETIDKLEKALLNFNKGLIKGIFSKLRRPLPNKYSLSRKEFYEVCLQGPAYLQSKFKQSVDNIFNVDSPQVANINKDIFDYFNDDWKNGHQYLRNNIGSFLQGNHFIEVQVADEIFDQEQASKWGVKEGQIFILYHMGQGGPSSVLNSEILNKIVYRSEFIGLNQGNKYYNIFRDTLKVLINYGLATRLTTFMLLQDVLNQITDLNYFSDHTHDFVKEIKKEDSIYFLYANNANLVKDDQPVVLSGLYNLKSYVGRGIPNNEILKLSDHGYGKATSNFSTTELQNKNQYTNHQVRKIALKNEINFSIFRHKESVSLKQSQAAEYVWTALEKNNILKKIFSLTPIINFRYTK
ncbi:MAG: hypothetical protein COV55_01030 [Candidatus Komeilibacteria bacterium CG11_big_fil_rev_8_21_14_0_20_36_20]|uniref:tRNA-splicing ligase RtcB n=1 Tax=Candidatus Komeilibacteria bacterium CG11_big_fil_rev_8_21_14_0_20_36_20 TaxID=1974477 RepID=A0A2H0NDL3_9BACT|nr:MAG: hypothetical protein COV55_01030 [Candidatus Komeilibacteria bacterium CG11_big_fil_rev_8_21_14_0_20_36_20]PIR81363.1 MAG: hypothetical protein COU21_04000 [Candidatus Komeilibacteria bacterium CG10_big_fil_rev_8_21_14_0_10_36_65]PJC54993.1 MAG: hypothetical protein CO027_04670 [Candidatus Komeilibacteria bacterium CG_4_9_14_0_2_um_filter_36_13]